MMKCKSLLDGSVSKAEFTVHYPSHSGVARNVANLNTQNTEDMDMGL